jgi:hypothetical protein
MLPLKTGIPKVNHSMTMKKINPKLEKKKKLVNLLKLSGKVVVVLLLL